MEPQRLGAPGCEIRFTAYHQECKLLGFIQQHMKEKKNRGLEALPSCDKLWICRFVEVLNNITQLEKYYFCANEVGVPSWIQRGSVCFPEQLLPKFKSVVFLYGGPLCGVSRCLANLDLIMQGRCLAHRSVRIGCLQGRGKTDGKQLQSIKQH